MIGGLASTLIVAAVFLFWPHPPRIQALAVLPFANLSGDPEQDLFAEGMTGELIFELSRLVPRVVSRQTAMNYRDSDKSLPEIARELNVDAVVESSLLKMGNHIKASVRLVNADNEETLWAETYERRIADVLGLYGQMTRDIAHAINLKLTAQEENQFEMAAIVDPEVYENYLKGRYWLWRTNKYDDFMKSAGYFQKACDLDSTFAPAQAGLATLYSTLFANFDKPEEQFCTKAREAAERALTLDENSPESHAAMANVYLNLDLDWEAAEREWARISPVDRIDSGYIFFLCLSGRFDEAIDWSRRFYEKEPTSLGRIHYHAMSYMYARRFDEAVPIYKNLLELDSNHTWGNFGLSVCYRELGRYPEADSLLAKGGFKISSVDYLIMGELEKVSENIENLLKRMNDSGKTGPAYRVSLLYAGLGQTKEALHWLEIASRDWPRDLLWVNTDPEFDYLRSDPEFISCIRRVGFTDDMVEISRKLTTDHPMNGT